MVLGVRGRVVEVLATMELAAALPLATTARRVDAVSVGEGDHRSLPSMLCPGGAIGAACCNRGGPRPHGALTSCVS